MYPSFQLLLGCELIQQPKLKVLMHGNFPDTTNGISTKTCECEALGETTPLL